MENEGVLFNTNLKLGIELVSFARTTFLERFGTVVKMSEILMFFSSKNLPRHTGSMGKV